MAARIQTAAWAGSLVDLVCPVCHGTLAETGPEDLTCERCAAKYPIVVGIPDLRLEPDPWIGLEADRAKARALDARTRGMGLEDTVRTYWSMTPDTPPSSADRFIAHVLSAESRSRQWLASVDAAREPGPNGAWLDVGCGTADLGVAAGRPVVGCDVALRWLVVAARRLAVAGLTPHLVCGNAERLPFPSSAFARVLALGLIEQVEDWPAAAREIGRVLEPGGGFHARTVNRFSLLAEPHVGVRGVGYVPRPWADRFVRWRTGQRYEHHHCRSARDVRRALVDAGFSEVAVGPARTLESDCAGLGDRLRHAVGIYEHARRLPGVRGILAWIAPMLDVHGRAR